MYDPSGLLYAKLRIKGIGVSMRIPSGTLTKLLKMAIYSELSQLHKNGDYP